MHPGLRQIQHTEVRHGIKPVQGATQLQWWYCLVVVALVLLSHLQVKKCCQPGKMQWQVGQCGLIKFQSRRLLQLAGQLSAVCPAGCEDAVI